MIAVVITCVVVIAALVVANLRLRSHVEAVTDLGRVTADERDAARAEAAVAADDATLARKQRDEALERGHRSRRDAAEVANRLSAETGARASLETELEVVRGELEEMRSAAALVDVLWNLSVRQAESTWRVSVAVDRDAVSPFVQTRDAFRTAVEIEVDAAREEAGADLELSWDGDAPVPTAHALLALAVVRDVVNALGTTTARTMLTVRRLDDAVEVAVGAVDGDGQVVAVPFPAGLETSPGTVRVDGSRGGRPGR
ncbi:hypothetical protein [Actinospongicola halichondriae]|uniref:hypothetical protein n=1 Tax=Actinospongicola halichondriae TaxID=3236844 RepID=UPI003D53ABFE